VTSEELGSLKVGDRIISNTHCRAIYEVVGFVEGYQTRWKIRPIDEEEVYLLGARELRQYYEVERMNVRPAAGEDVIEKPGILERAKELVHGDRRAAYGSVKEDMTRIAKLWSAILGQPILPEEVVLCMIAVKISRLCHKIQEDSMVDIAGYAEVLSMLVREKG